MIHPDPTNPIRVQEDVLLQGEMYMCSLPSMIHPTLPIVSRLYNMFILINYVCNAHFIGHDIENLRQNNHSVYALKLTVTLCP